MIAKRTLALPCRVGAILAEKQRTYDLTLEDDVVLGDPAFDAARVALLLQRVLEAADQLERQHFGEERDAAIEAFAADLLREGVDD